MTGPPHPEYTSLALPKTGGVALTALVEPLQEVLARGTLYAHAARHSERRELAGRAPAYAIPIGIHRVVVRHVWHGGLLASVTRDLFLVPTRAPHELAVSTRLRRGGVPTPEVVAYVTYEAGPLLRRADVATREIPNAADLGALLADPARTEADRAALWEATARLVESLARVGAFHADLNVKNVLISTDAGNDGTGDGARRYTAFAIDVDRVAWRHPGDPALIQAHRDRLYRSARKSGVL